MILEEKKGIVEIGAPNSAYLLNKSIFMKIHIIYLE